MLPDKFHRGFESLLLLCNAVLVFIVLVKLHVSPGDVYQRVQQSNSEMLIKAAEIAARQDAMQSQMDSRQIWIEQLTSCISDAANQRWTQTDEREVWSEVFAANPTLFKPLNFYPEFKQPGTIKLPEIPNKD
jgi:hypothetical protein